MPVPVRRPTFDELNLSTGKRARLHRFMYEHGPANGTLMLLPIDQGLEHGPIDFFSNPESIDTDWIYRLAGAGNFSGMALHVGLAEKYHKPYAGKMPKPYDTLQLSDLDGLRKVVKSAGRSLVLVSGGSKISDEDMIHKAQMAMEAGCVGLIFGRNMWQRDWDDALLVAGRMHEL